MAACISGQGSPVAWASLWTEERDYRRLWALSQVTVRTYQLDEPHPAGDNQPLVDAELARWKPWEREQYRLLLLRQSGTGVWLGSAQGKARAWRAGEQRREIYATDRPPVALRGQVISTRPDICVPALRGGRHRASDP